MTSLRIFSTKIGINSQMTCGGRHVDFCANLTSSFDFPFSNSYFKVRKAKMASARRLIGILSTKQIQILVVKPRITVNSRYYHNCFKCSQPSVTLKLRISGK